ncbi:MAG: ATP-binding protein [Microscillaceae bacterium]|nr:ATP-binding protein [Microscillaceae bacterium]
MKIESLTYFDHSQGWGFENLEFSKLNLLVGASGVGKTQILRAIEELQDIAQGTYSKGIVWQIIFKVNEDKTYIWEGDLSETETEFTPFQKNEPIIKFEKLTLNEEILYCREKTGITFKGSILPFINSHDILLPFFKEDEMIREAYVHLNYIFHFDDAEYDQALPWSYIKHYETIIKDVNLLNLRGSIFSLKWKLYFLQKKSEENEEFAKLWSTILQSYKDIFPQVESIEFLLSYRKGSNSKFFPTIRLIEKKHPETPISEEDISSGMLKTLLMLAQIYLIPDNSVVLVDELENSLGVNCMDTVLENIVFENRGQFILTSHHPYIINHIPYERWLIITRENGKIIAHKANEFDLGKSRHDNFIKLTNLKAFKEGVTV